LHAKDGILTGLVGGEMMFSHSKGDMLKRIQNILGVSEEDTMVVGDGANDLSMFKYAKTRVAFCAKEVLKKEANIIIEEKDLTKILDFI
jgi:phosphoserine phosphatase